MTLMKGDLLSNKVCLITGCGKGLGEATLIAFAQAGASVIYANDIVENSIEVTDKLVQWTYGINVFGSMDLLQLATKLMLRQKCGSIINLSSIVGINGNPGQLVYSSTKGAIISMTKTAAKELAPRGIRVNAIAPGMIDTDMMRSIGEKHLAVHIKNIPMGRLGKPEEIANTAVFLASDMSSYISGQVITVDGCVLV